MQSVADMTAKVMGVKRDQGLTLQGLEEDENLELFIHHAFSGLNPGDYLYLQSTGRQIAKKLRGCPLVTKVVGEHLQGNITLEYWSRFLHQGLEHFKGTEEDIMKVLRLSYYHLPTELQICFRYCCLFPQDYEFEKKQLVQLWIGSGLISQPASDTQTLVNTAEQFLAQLTRKSFFDLKSRAGQYKQEESYVMHDLMHELARNVSTGECAIIDDHVQLKYEKDTVRHLCIVNLHRFSFDEVKKISQFKNLRSIIIYNNHWVKMDVVCALGIIVESSKSLRLFYSKLWNAFVFSDKIGTLKHLRYIYMHQISPDLICEVAKLYHLMVLRGYYGSRTETYEERYLGNLEGLRYVSYGNNGFGHFDISRLTNLQELDNYQVGGRICNKISAIGNLRELHTLEVKNLEKVENYEEARNANLKEKSLLKELHLEWSTPDQTTTDDLVLDHLEPHANIRVLQIHGYKGPKIPFWIQNRSVTKLVSLTLFNCTNWEYLPSLGEFEFLKFLILQYLPKLQQIGGTSDMSGSSSMELLLPQSLHTLVVSQCEKLRELPILPPSLVSLQISEVCLTKLPTIGKISSESTESRSSKLIDISVTDCPYLTSLEGSLLEQKEYMGALHVLTVERCIHLESMSVPFEEMKELKELEISKCPKLRMMTDAKDKVLLSSSLRELTIGQCGDLELPLLRSLQLLTNLSGLKLRNCSSLASLPSTDVFQCLRSLRYVGIEGCENLLSLGGLGSLSSLNSLSIAGCSKLGEAAGSSLIRVASGSGGEEGHLMEPTSSLQITRLITDLPSLLLVEPLKSLCGTENVHIHNGSEMQCLPERWLLQNRSSLQSLGISKARSLKSLPPSMQDLCSLEKLWIDDAGQLQSLPYLPSSLNRLYISGCHPDLEKKVTEHGSSEWNKIAHIPDAVIGGRRLFMGKNLA